MKLLKKILLISFLAILCFVIVGFFKIKSESNKAINSIQISNIDLLCVDDGSYIGDFSSGPCYAKVKVTVKNNEIQKISILEHRTGMGRKAESIVHEVIKKQSLENDDIISGATVSSKVILKAIENALSKGGV